MFHQIQSRLQEEVSGHIQTRYGLDLAVVLEEPSDAKFGELALTVAFALAKQLKKAPRVIAQELVDDLGTLPGVVAMEIAGAGYINIRLDRGAYAASLIAPPAAATAAAADKVIVEHTNINPNKAAHIGHLRNSVLGDTFVRMLRASGQTVEVQNYIDNTGVQVSDVVAGFHHLEHKTAADVTELAKGDRFDYLCWDLYARTSQHFKDHPEDEKAWQHEALHAIETGEGDLAELGHVVADAIVLCHLRTMRRLGIIYDVLPRESEILHLQFWATAFEQLKERQAIYLETEGNKKGCWVMAGSYYSDSDDDSKVIVRSNGIVTYVGKDIAYQMWKFGVLGKDFHYRKLLTEADGHEVWVSTAEPQPANNAPKFGGGATVYNVIDTRQSYLQDVVAAGLRALGYTGQAERSIHFNYEMVALTPRTCVELGIELSDEDKSKAHVQVSGRKGLGVKANDLLDKLIEKALGEVESRHADATVEERRAVATQIAIGALRYFMLKFTRNTVIAFDLGEALAFTGETGPYLQYAAVRAKKILHKLAEQGDQLDCAALTPEMLARQLASDDFWHLLMRISKVDSAVAKAVTAGEPSHVARYAFQLAQAFSGFYDKYSVKDEADAERKQFLIWMTGYFRQQLERVAAVLGIPLPQYM
ncbi:MAG: arginine--tRNA ligase [Acidobacteria bacterium]|nr:arginine--tRNA ligase [Acidobacteriota bacterium]